MKDDKNNTTPALLLTTNEAAKALGVSKRTLQDLTYGRQIGFVKFGRNMRYTQADLTAFIESNHHLPVGWKRQSK
jgi:excisionase family DNA binding protein